MQLLWLHLSALRLCLDAGLYRIIAAVLGVDVVCPRDGPSIVAVAASVITALQEVTELVCLLK